MAEAEIDINDLIKGLSEDQQDVLKKLNTAAALYGGARAAAQIVTSECPKGPAAEAQSGFLLQEIQEKRGDMLNAINQAVELKIDSNLIIKIEELAQNTGVSFVSQNGRSDITKSCRTVVS